METGVLFAVHLLVHVGVTVAAKALKPSIIVVAAEPGNQIFLLSICMTYEGLHLFSFAEAANDAYRSKQTGERVGASLLSCALVSTGHMRAYSILTLSCSQPRSTSNHC